MSDLRNQTPSTTYKGLLQVNDYSNGVDATSKFVQDGEGTNSALSISTTKVGVGTSTPSAPLDVTSTTGGVVFPRLTTIQRDLINSPTDGETIYNTTTTQVESYNGTEWVAGGATVVATDAVTSDSIANDAVTPAKLDDTQAYTVNGLTSTSNIAIDGNLNATGTIEGTNVVESRGSLNQVIRAHSNDNLGYLVLLSGGEALNQKRVNLVPSGGKFVVAWVNDGGGAGLLVQLDQATGDWEPGNSGSQDLGSTGLRWDNVWSAGTFNGSDQNIKQDIEDLDEAEKRVAVKAKGLIKKYRMKDAVAKKGDDARIHVGIIAQELQTAFESEGLDAFRYSMIGKDTWWEGTDSEGNRDVKYEATDGYTKVTQMSVRYNELLAFIISAM